MRQIKMKVLAKPPETWHFK